jgi:hypothetical protein
LRNSEALICSLHCRDKNGKRFVTHTKKQNNRNKSVESRAESAALLDCCMQTRVCTREGEREREREREHKKRGGESNGVDCDEESGDQTGVRKVVPK